MAQIEVLMPKMGESITEATIIQWSKQIGEEIQDEETLLEIATDKVDSEIPSPAMGVLVKTFFNENDVVTVGAVIALIATEGSVSSSEVASNSSSLKPRDEALSLENDIIEQSPSIEKAARPSTSDRFYSPLVRSIAEKENISLKSLGNIRGSGQNGRVTKKDILSFLKKDPSPVSAQNNQTKASHSTNKVGQSLTGEMEIIEMDRTRRLIADHMVKSKQTSAHVTSFVEVDVTNIVNWRKAVKEDFKTKHQENITFTPIFIESVAKAIIAFPRINVSVDGTKILVKKDINVGMATALPSGNLIVPVIKNADQHNLVDLVKKVNNLAKKARENKLKPQDIQAGTFTVTNVGTFGNVMGTPIINQPQVAILSTGIIKKKPAVLETEYGDIVAVRQMMFLSLSYDHRVVDGMLGGSFLRRIADYLEQFDTNREV